MTDRSTGSTTAENPHLATDSFFAAITDLSASLRRKDITRSGLSPPVGLASGVICPALKYCSTGFGTAAAAMCEITCTNKSLFPAREPKSYQCFARVPNGPGSLSRGMLRSVMGTCSATSDKNRVDTGACTGAGGSGSAGWTPLISWIICFVIGIGGAFLVAARARPFSPVRANVATLRTRDCICCLSV